MSPPPTAGAADRTGPEPTGTAPCHDGTGTATLGPVMKWPIFALAVSSLALTGQAQAASSCPPGFAMLQASDTCVRISGRVRGETFVGSSRLRASDSVRTGAGGRVRLDVRKQTEYGPVRAVISVGNLGR